MKPLLRAVLLLDALLLLMFGLLFVLTPWRGLYDALQLVQAEPALVGQGFGVALVGLAWLALHASFNGALTVPVARVVGHVNWLTGLLMLVWLIGLHTPDLTGFGQLVAGLVGAVLIIVGLGGVRLCGAVRRREKVHAATREAHAEVTARPKPVTGMAQDPALTASHTAGAVPSAVAAEGVADDAHAASMRNEARDAAADAPAMPRPPFHG
ncbi:hypothetical protein [Paraburkholderia hayleyella]|uniref:hypothetical protein n=1 Tax=Paraburkholderia hayleyella TaxID=2152889 RepID=UPI001291C896|nr:hypothetical protein [Paraburkholderia hayleyella]